MNEQRGNQFTRSVNELTKRNIDCIRDIEEAAKAERSSSDRIAVAIANFCGSMTFVWVHAIWFGAWILANSLPGLSHIDPFPFTFLTLVVSLEAIFLSTFILISQNHDSKISDRRNNLDLQINLLSEQENTQMLMMLKAIAEKVGVKIDLQDQVEALAEETEPKQLINQIKAGEE